MAERRFSTLQEKVSTVYKKGTFCILKQIKSFDSSDAGEEIGLVKFDSRTAIISSYTSHSNT